MLKKMLCTLILLFTLTLAGTAQVTDPREFKTLVWNNSHVVSYEKRGKSLVITMEMIADFEEDRTSPKWQERDFASIRIDRNNNRNLDRYVDISFGQASGTERICPQFLISRSSSSMCGRLLSGGSLNVSFDRSPFQETKHPVFEFSIPITELNTHSGTIGFVFKFHSGNKGFTYYPTSPSSSRSFEETIPLDLDQL